MSDARERDVQVVVRLNALLFAAAFALGLVVLEIYVTYHDIRRWLKGWSA